VGEFSMVMIWEECDWEEEEDGEGNQRGSESNCAESADNVVAVSWPRRPNSHSGNQRCVLVALHLLIDKPAHDALAGRWQC
jgi:hypothetical protein